MNANSNGDGNGAVAAYLRVSTRDQKLDSQRREVERCLDARGLDGVRWFTDKATGSNTERPGFQKMQTEIAARRVKEVVVWKLERAFRNALDCLRTVEEWERLGVSLRIMDLGGQPIDTKSAAGKFMLTVIAAVAEMERANAKERQRAGIDAWLAKLEKAGKSHPGGRPRGAYKVDPKRVAELRSRGLTYDEIGKALGISRPTVRKMLTLAGINRRSGRPSNPVH